MKRGWIFLILPALLGLLLKIAFERGWLENSVAYLRADLGTLALILGFFLTGLLFIIWGIFLWQDRQFNQEFIEFQGPAFLEVIIDPDAGVYPMVGPGLTYDKMITGDFIVGRDKPSDEKPGPSQMF